MRAISNEVSIWRRMIDAHSAALSTQAAKSLLELDFAPSDRRRMDVLSRRMQRGQLSQLEQHELQTYVRAGHILARIQSKARRTMKSAPASS